MSHIYSLANWVKFAIFILDLSKSDIQSRVMYGIVCQILPDFLMIHKKSGIKSRLFSQTL